LETLNTILNGNKTVVGLTQELKDTQNGKKRNFFTSEFLEHSNVEYVNLLNKTFYSSRDKMLEKSRKFRDNKGNEDKYGINAKKQNAQKIKEYLELSYPTMMDDVWEVELEIKLVKKAISSKSQ
jgi:hypothetical protein